MQLIKIGSNMRQANLPDGTVVLYSYETPVAASVPGRGYLRTSTKWSQTTSRHINKWLGGIQATEVPQNEINALVN